MADEGRPASGDDVVGHTWARMQALIRGVGERGAELTKDTREGPGIA